MYLRSKPLKASSTLWRTQRDYILIEEMALSSFNNSKPIIILFGQTAKYLILKKLLWACGVPCVLKGYLCYFNIKWHNHILQIIVKL
jgi:hypothetical protein